MEPRRFLTDLLRVAIDAALPAKIVPPAIAGISRPRGRTVVIGAGKASAAMAQAFESAWGGPLAGIVATRYGHAVPCRQIEILEAGHPVPDAAGERAARRILTAVEGLTDDDLVVALISGGGSALLPLPNPGMSLTEEQALTRKLLNSGARISEINTVRKHLSAVKGGQLGLACRPARLVTLVLSDVPGDDPSMVASGPTIADPTTVADAEAVLERYGIPRPPGLRETPKSLEGEVHLVGSARLSLEAAARYAEDRGVRATILGDAIEGEAREVAREQAALARRSGPGLLLSGGETTVTVRGEGVGGRNVEYLAALAEALEGAPDVWAIAADTDGIDGMGEAAGAIVTPTTGRRARELGMPLADVLARNDAHGLFTALGDSVVLGPTLTNVNDFRAIWTAA